VIDKTSGQIWMPDIHEFVNIEQSEKFSRDPEMILEFAHFLADRFRTQTGRTPEVHALVLTSLNGRKPQLLIDPEVDLIQEPRGFRSRSWIVPLVEPLRREPWRAPLNQWERQVEIPPLTFLAGRFNSAGKQGTALPPVSVAGPTVMARAAAGQ
jgi:hypothetical protein